MDVKIYLEDWRFEEHEKVYSIGTDEATGFIRLRFEGEPTHREVFYRPDTVHKVVVQGAV